MSRRNRQTAAFFIHNEWTLLLAPRPYTETRITHHTLWQALTGQLPPMALPPLPIANAAIDSRDIQPGDLFVALPGSQTDGHNYIGVAFEHGAQAVICEERGAAAARQAGAALVNCTAGRWALLATLPEGYQPGVPLAYLVDDSLAALQAVGAFQRLHRTRPDLRVYGVTGSVGKTSTKELAANVLRVKYQTLASAGNLNSEQGLPLTLLGLDHSHERAILEMGMYAVGEIATLCQLARPQVGIVTNVGPVHLERLGTIENIQQAKAELVQALPAADDGGVAVLNWDDERVRAMAPLTRARILRYGLTAEADLWADEIQGMGMEGIRFRFHYRRPGAKRGKIEALHVKAPLLGRHSVHTALRAAAVGLIEEMGWDEIVAGIQNMPAQLRLVVLPGVNGCTVIDDTYNASPASTIAAINLLADVEPTANGRRVAVLGDMRELGSFTDEGHKLVGRRVADVANVLVTVGDLGAEIAAEAAAVGFPAERIHRLQGDLATLADGTVALLREILHPHDLVLVKGSRAVGMEAIAAEITAGNGSPRNAAAEQEIVASHRKAGDA
jgi:UDP-N-acetylmuramoyl-tripeptide--D-alanyl-D-alanine ligase